MNAIQIRLLSHAWGRNASADDLNIFIMVYSLAVKNDMQHKL